MKGGWETSLIDELIGFFAFMGWFCLMISLYFVAGYLGAFILSLLELV